MDRLNPRSIDQAIASQQIQAQRQQRQQAEAEALCTSLGLTQAGGPSCAIYLSNSAIEKQRTRWLETRLPWMIDRGQVRIDWRQHPNQGYGSGPQPPGALVGHLMLRLSELAISPSRVITLHWFNFCDPVLDLPLEQLRPSLGAIVSRNQPTWFFDHRADWCIELWPPDLHWGQWPQAFAQG